MSYLLYVSNLPDEITLDDLIIYFQSKKSGGGDVDADCCKLDGNNAVVAFEKKENFENVLRKSHEFQGHKLEIRDKPVRVKPVPKKRKSFPVSKREEKVNNNSNEEKTETENERAYLGEVRTVIVKGLSPETTDEHVQLFFGNERRTGGGGIENMERCKPDVVYITFASAEVAARVLKNVKLELHGYLLQLKGKQPELILPKDRKKLLVENINPKTKDETLMHYMEGRTKMLVENIQRGDHGNALITFDEEPDINKLTETNKPLEEAVLKISNPPVCNSILISGLTKNTTKDTIEMYFENEKNGGGTIYRDVIYQRDKGKAVVSFCDPQVLKTLIEREHKLDGVPLTLCQHYQFLNEITETTYSTIKLSSDILSHVVKKCEEEIRVRFGAETLEIIQERKEEIQLPEEVAKEIEKFMEQFTVEEIPFCKKLLDASKDELNKMVKTANERNVTITIEEELPQMKIVGMKKYTKEIYEHFKKKIHEMEKDLDVILQKVSLPQNKLELFLLHDINGQLASKFHVSVKIEPRKEIITLEGPKEQVFLALAEAYESGGRIVEENIDLSEEEKHFLQSGGLRVLNNGMKIRKLKGMIFLNYQIGTSILKVLLFEDTSIDDVKSYLNQNMFVEKFPSDEESRTLLKSDKWKHFCEDSIATSSVMICASATRSSEISLVGKIEKVKKIHEEVKEFMARNTIVRRSVDLEKGYAEYLNEYCTKNLEEVETKLQVHYVRIHPINDNGKIDIDGTKEGVRKAEKYIHDIIKTISRGKMCLEKQRDQEYIQSEQGTIAMNTIETKNKCFIRLIKDDQPSKFFCSYETQERISLKVLKDDLVAHSCDVMVNAANKELKHIGGVAKAILDAGGEKIQKECDAFVNENGPLPVGECFSGSPGKLPCKRLIHAVGPRWDASKREKTCNTLRNACTRVLEEAKDCRSIALPSIGSGIFGIPKETCAEIMIEAAEEFGQKNPDSALKDIRFVNNDDLTCQVFLKKFREKFLGRSTFTDNKKSERKTPEVPFEGPPRSYLPASRSQRKINERKKTEVSFEVSPLRTPVEYIVTQRNMKISVIVGDLSTYKADVLVNTTGENLNLDSNACGKALSNEAGPTLQAECNRIGKLQAGQVAETSGGNLLCDKVYHVVCVQWNQGAGEQVLRSIVKNCLNKCNASGKSSIAFPAIGTGVLGFPRDVAAKVFFEETKEFEKRVSNCNIKEVSFVVYNQDAKSIEAFKSELKKQPQWRPSVTVPGDVAVPSKRRTRRMISSLTTRTTGNESRSSRKIETKGSDNSVLSVQIKDKEIEIAKGDITKETTDVIAHLTNPQLIMNSGVAKALAHAGGQEIIRECKRVTNSDRFIGYQTTVLTGAGQLDVKYVAHMVGSNDPTYNEIENCITNCLQTVNGKECESISFPAVGTGSLKHDPTKAATTILTSVKHFLDSNPESLRLVRIVLKDDDLVTAFEASAKKLTENEEPGMLRRIANYFTKPHHDSTTISVKQKPVVNRKKLSLEIYAKDDDTVERAKARIQKLLEEQNKKETLEDDNIEKLSRRQVTEIEELCKMNDVKLASIENDRIVVVGYRNDISETFTQIRKILKRISEAEREKENAALHADLADMVSLGVQWCFVDPTSGHNEKYDKQANVMIERAYKKKEKSIIFLFDDERCEIVFDKMEETNLLTNEKMKVIRKELEKGIVADVLVPRYWEAQPKDANGKDVVVHLVTLDPNKPNHMAEYKKVSDHFRQTAPQQNILQIQRVQNPEMYKKYLITKQGLDNKSGSNEKFLFHGTNDNNVNKINEKGLNRSFAGNTHGAVYGKGVYFARDASMSAGYAPAMPGGKRYMYYTRVAVGQYAVGNGSMLVPPLKGGSGTDSYDSTVNNVGNPTIFVLFYDSQYYPEYLITFN